MNDAVLQHPWASKIAMAVGVAAVLGAGNTIITNKVDLVKLQAQVSELSALRVEMKETRTALRTVSKDLAVLVDRGERDQRRRDGDER